MQIVMDTEGARPGEILAGRVVDHGDGDVWVRLRRMEGEIAQDAAETTLGPDGRFSLTVPDDAVPGFRDGGLSFLSWGVHAGVGERPDATAPIVVQPHPEDVPITSLPGTDPASAAARAAEARKLRTGGEGVTMMAFIVVLLASAGFGLYLAVVPTEGLEGNRVPGLVWAAVSLALLAPAYLRFRNVKRPGKVRNADFLEVPSAARPGDEVTVRLRLAAGDAVQVGHVALRSRVAKTRASSGGQVAAGWIHKVVAESWERVEGPDPTVRIVIDPTAPPSYRGDQIVIDHAIWIRPEKARSSRWNMSRNESPLVVVA